MRTTTRATTHENNNMTNNAPSIKVKEQFIRPRFILTVAEAAANNFNTACGLPHTADLLTKIQTRQRMPIFENGATRF